MRRRPEHSPAANKAHQDGQDADVRVGKGPRLEGRVVVVVVVVGVAAQRARGDHRPGRKCGWRRAKLAGIHDLEGLLDYHGGLRGVQFSCP